MPTSHPYTWSPQPTGARPPGGASRPASSRRGLGGTIGALLAGAFGFLKYGLVFLKFGKLGGTLISFAVSLLIYMGIFGWQFGIGALLLIAIHEMGHLLVARLMGLPVTAPIFLGPFGAVVGTRGFRDARQEALVALGGPAIGTGAALLCFVWAQATGGRLHFLLLALAYFGCLVNLFNLIPMSPLDGGRVASAVSRWANVVGVIIVVLLIGGYYASGSTPNPFLILILLFGIFSTVGRFRRAKLGAEPPAADPRTRALIGVAYATMLVIAAVGMSISHGALLSAGYGQPVA